MACAHAVSAFPRLRLLAGIRPERAGDARERIELAIEHNALLSAEAKEIQFGELEKTRENFDTVFDATHYQALVDSGQRRLSYAAFVSALMIHLYRDEPMFHTPFRDAHGASWRSTRNSRCGVIVMRSW